MRVRAIGRGAGVLFVSFTVVEAERHIKLHINHIKI